jgi:hypothetical protein
MDEYPDFCLRGLSKNDIDISNNSPTSNAFYPEEKTAMNRPDGGMEKSINWEDDAAAVEVTLRAFPTGYARIARSAIEKVKSLPGVNNSLSYERAPLQNNRYHGNIVYRRGLTRSHMRAISSALLLCCIEIVLT